MYPRNITIYSCYRRDKNARNSIYATIPAVSFLHAHLTGIHSTHEHGRTSSLYGNDRLGNAIYKFIL